MSEAVKDPTAAPRGPADELLQYYFKNRSHRIPQTVTKDGTVDDEAIVEIFQWHAADFSYRAYKAREVEKKAWIKLMLQLHNLGRAYSEQILVTNFYNSFSANSSLSSPTPSVLKMCFHLYVLYTLEQYASSFTTTTAVSPEAVYTLQDSILELIAELRPYAVKLVDAWSIPDWLLDNALGRSDGKVDEDFFYMAHRRREEMVLGSWDGGRHLLAKL